MEEITGFLQGAIDGTEFELKVSRRRETTLMRREPDQRTMSTDVDTEILGRFTCEELRKTYEQSTWHSGEWGERLRITPVYGDGIGERSTSRLRALLKDYVDSECGHVGHALVDSVEGRPFSRIPSPGFRSEEKVSTLGDFRDYLTVAAAVLGANRVATHVGAWINGGPVQYRGMALLVGVRLDEPLMLNSGIRIERLSTRSGGLPESLPGFGSEAPENYLGGVVLSVDCQAAPGLFRPTKRPDGDWEFTNDVTLFHLARECAESHPELARDLRETHAALSSRWREQGLADNARASVLEAADRLGRKLVLIVENLQSLCVNTDKDFGWQLRAVLQSEPQIMLLASATSRFEGLDDAEEPYFELFRTVDLKPLDTEECRLLWQVVSGERRSEFEIRPLEILTGGSPRLLAIIAGFARHRSLRQLMEELVTLIDEHTEYFRGHLEALPRSERRVYVALIDLWQPSSAGDIAARARVDIRIASTMLGRLVGRGAVTADSARGSRKRLYAAAESLYSIYYKLRREGDEAAVVENLIRFMVVFYDTVELFGIHDRLRDEAIASKTILAGIDRALARRPESDDLRSQMKWNRIKDVSETVRSRRHLEARIRLDEDVRAATSEEEWGKLIEAADRFIASGVSSSTTGMEDHDRVYTAVLKSEGYFQMGQFGRVVSIGASIVDRFRDTRDMFILYWSARVLFLTVKAHFELRDFGATVSNAREMDRWFERYKDDQFDPVVAEALVVQAKAEAELGNVGAAVSLLDTVVQRFEASEHPEVRDSVVGALVTKAGSLRMQGNDDEGALAVYAETVERYGTSEVPEIRSRIISALLNRAFTQASLGDFEGEIASYQEVIERIDDNETPDADWSAVLALGFKAMRQAETGRTDEALVACSELERALEKWTGDRRA